MADGKKDKKGEWKKKAITELKEHWMRDILLVFGGMWFAGLLGQALRLPIAAAKMRENGFDGKVSEIVRECFSANPIHCIIESTNSKYDRQVMIFNQDTDYHEVKSRGQRKVMNKDEVLRMKNTDELLLLRCQKPILCKKFDYTLHPESKKFIKSSPADHIPKWRAEKMREEAENRAKAEQLLQNAAKRKEEELAYVKYTKTTRTSSASVEPATSVATAKAETSSASSTAKATNASKTSEVQGVQNKSAKKSNEQAKTEAFIDGIDFDLFSEENSKAEKVKEADASTSQLGQSSQLNQPNQDFWSDEDIEERNIETDFESDDYDEDDEDEYEYCA